MSEVFSESTVVNENIEEVWGFLIDMEENASKWMPNIPYMKKSSTGQVNNGTSFTFKARGKEQTSTITQFNPNEKFTLTSIQGDFRADYTYSLTKQADNTTKVSLVAKCEASGMMKMVAPLIKIAIKKADGGQLNTLKKVIEKGK
ncbi:SRPBCC family protein [Chengkuizengella axinellae]|uniref:SRPBCC family protein n=1 Tax=Chengkuizengella axinellae TaxID=3064388 RepID=A0ABT9J203_9BACL|nr:SRPBCC family protein [Chengkuizengella sp. 2205SS18-9]MDP5275646.1 SRPBCC family protein [Chengkuizengella sp. 2205SS18-9]